MIYSLKNGSIVIIRSFTSSDYENLYVYYNSLTTISRSRFAPHRFDREGIGMTFSTTNDLCGYVAIDTESGLIVGYAVCKIGFYVHDKSRFESYGFELNEFTDCFYAPSISEDWHGRGLGKLMFNFIIEDMCFRNVSRIFLWGGVQISNEGAVGFYNSLGFANLGEFEHNGLNRDMVFTV